MPENFGLANRLALEERSLQDHVDSLEASSALWELSFQLIWPFPCSVNMYWFILITK